MPFYCDEDVLTMCVLQSAVELQEGVGRVCHHSHLRIPSHQDAALRILGCVADVNEHTVEGRHVDQAWQLAITEIVLLLL